MEPQNHISDKPGGTQESIFVGGIEVRPIYNPPSRTARANVDHSPPERIVPVGTYRPENAPELEKLIQSWNKQ